MSSKLERLKLMLDPIRSADRVLQQLAAAIQSNASIRALHVEIRSRISALSLRLLEHAVKNHRSLRKFKIEADMHQRCVQEELETYCSLGRVQCVQLEIP